MLLIKNPKAHFEYEFSRKIEAGMVLLGHEVKSLRLKRGSLQGAFVKIIAGEAWLLNSLIPLYAFLKDENYDPHRSRKLLLHKKELLDLTQLSQQKGIALIPISILLINNRIKLEIGVGKGKKLHDKRQTIKKRDLDRQMQKLKKNRFR